MRLLRFALLGLAAAALTVWAWRRDDSAVNSLEPETGGAPEEVRDVRRRAEAPDASDRGRESIERIELGASAQHAHGSAADAPAPPRVEVARVIVVDASGLPLVGARVGVYEDAECWLPLCVFETAGPEACAVIAFEPERHRAFAEEGEELWIALDAALFDRERVNVDLSTPPAEPIRLKLGACGSLRLRIDTSGFVGSELTATIQVVEVQDRWPAPSEVAPMLRRTLEGSELRLRWVELGRRFYGTFISDGGVYAGEFELAGPTHPGQEVVADLTLDPGTPRLVGRLLDVEGRPLARTGFRAISTVFGEIWNTVDSATDELGGFSVVGLDLSNGQDWLHFGTMDGHLQVGVETRSPRRTPVFDLGDLVLEPRPLLAAGRVVDAGGGGVVGARVDAVRLQENGDWNSLSTSGVETDSEGRFELWGLCSEVSLGLRVEHEQRLVADPVPIERGRSDLVIELQSGGALEGWVRLDDGLPSGLIEIELIGVEEPRLPRRPAKSRAPRGLADGQGFTFEHRRLRPGQVTLRLGLLGDPEPLLVVKGVAIAEGETTRDERLQGIDLRGLLHLHRLEAVEASGAPVPDVDVEWRPAGASVPVARGTDLEGWHLSRHPVVDVVVSAPGFRSRALPSVCGAVRLVLEPGIPMELELAEDLTLFDQEWLQLTLVPEGMSLGEAQAAGVRMPTVVFEENRSARILFSEPGRYRALWWLSVADDPLPDRSETFVVEDTATVMRKVVGPDASAVARLRDAHE